MAHFSFILQGTIFMGHPVGRTERKYSNLRNRGHPYKLPDYCTNLHKKSFIIQSLYLIFLTFVSCLVTVTLHIVDVRLTGLKNITYLLTYLVSYLVRRPELACDA